MAEDKEVICPIPSKRKARRLNKRQQKKFGCGLYTFYLAKVTIHLKEPVRSDEVGPYKYSCTSPKSERSELNLSWLCSHTDLVKEPVIVSLVDNESPLMIKGLKLGHFIGSYDSASIIIGLEDLRNHAKVERLDIEVVDAIYNDKVTGESYVYEKFTM